MDSKSNKKAKWQQVKRKTIYENAWLTLFEDDVIMPNAEQTSYSIIDFKNRAAATIPIDSNGFTYLVGQYRYPLNKYSWELPMGGALWSEDVLVGAQRELREEAGIIAQTWTEILRFDTLVSIGREEAVVYVAQDLSFVEPQTEDTEELQLQRVHIDEAIELALKGEYSDSTTDSISDSITMAGLFKLATMKQQFGL